MDIYIKADQKVTVYAQKSIKIKDIAEVYAPDTVRKSILNTTIMIIDSNEETKQAVSIIKIIKKLSESYPNATINSVGESDILICFYPNEKKRNQLWCFTKIAFITLILITGSSTAIMSFHTDAQVPQVFKNYYYIFFGEISQNPLLLDLPYSVGLAIGILVFFNHFNRKKITDDPTPIEVQLHTFEEEVTESIIGSLMLRDKEKKENAQKQKKEP